MTRGKNSPTGTEKGASELRDYLANDSNTVSRESLLKWRFLHEMSLAAAKAKYPLSVFLPEVDREGIDVILGDGTQTVPIQLKSTISRVTPGFVVTNVHQSVLKPSIAFAGQLHFEISPSGIGQQGALVLIEIIKLDLNPLNVGVRYWVTTPFILRALENEWAPGAPLKSKDYVRTLLANMRNGLGTDRVELKAGCMIPASSASALLRLMGLNSPLPKNAVWQQALLDVLNPKPESFFEKQTHPPALAPKIREGWLKSRREQVESVLKIGAAD